VSEPTPWWNRLRQAMKPELTDLRVALYGSGGAPYHHAGLVALWGGAPVPLRAEEIGAGALDDVDVIVFPGGGMRAMSGLLDPLGVDGARAVRRWVADGGMYLGSCAGSFLPAAVGDGYWQAHAEARELHMVGAPLANGGDSEFESLTSPGVGTIEVEVSDPQHWLADGLPGSFQLVHYNGPLFDLGALRLAAAHGEGELAAPSGAVRPVGATAAFTFSEGFLGPAPAPGTSLFEHCVKVGAHNAIAAPYGAGTVVLFGSHPEFGFDALQLGWGPGSRLIANALRHQAEQKRKRTPPEREAGRDDVATGSGSDRSPDAASAASPSSSSLSGNASEEADAASVGGKMPSEYDLRELLIASADRLDALTKRFVTLIPADTGTWLEPGNAASFLGRDPATLWREALERAAEVAPANARQLRDIAASGAELGPLRRWIDDPPNANQDYGFMGLVQLLDTAERMTATAERQLSAEPVPMAHAYDALDIHPYQQLVGSYLSAVGLVACTALSSAVIAAGCGLEPGALAGYLLADALPVEV
jgi:hypothetical protein